MALVLRPAGIADRGALLELFQIAFGAPADPADWTWKYDRNPHHAVSVLAQDGERVVGHFGAFGTRYRGAEGSHPGMSGVDFMTHPSARALGRRNLFKQLGDTLHVKNGEFGVPFGFGFPHERARRMEEKILGYRVVERAGLLERPLPSPASPPRLLSRFRRLREGGRFDRAHAPLGERLHARAGWRTERSAEVLNWRFSRPGIAYHLVQSLDLAGRSRGYAVVRAAGERALLLDLQLAREDSGALRDLVGRASEYAERAGCRRLEIRLPTGGCLAARLRAELGFSDGISDTVVFVYPFRDDFDLDRAAPLFDYRFLDHDIF